MTPTANGTGHDGPEAPATTRWSSDETTERGTVPTNGVETYYERRGSGPPIVFIHGMAMSSGQWGPQLASLADEYTTIAYDVRGHGRTGGSDRETYTMDTYAADLDALLTALDVERPVLCGLSMGGCIAQAYAVAHPETVAGLVLSDTFTAAPLPPSGRLLFTNLRFFGRLDRVVRYTTLNRVQTRIGNWLSPGVAGDGETVQRLMEASPTITHREFRKIAESVASFPDGDLDLSTVTAPVLVMHGEHVPAVFREMADRIAAELSNAEVETAVVPDAGHASNVDNPGFFTDAVRGFLDEVADTSP